MNWAQFATIVFINLSVNIGLILWLVQRHDSFRRESMDLIIANRDETQAILQAIQAEMRDFHGRLCAIEERRK